MPYITIEGGELSPSQKEDLIKQITEAVSYTHLTVNPSDSNIL